jgi:LacI family transcriptional regulator, repressor for deo operon, udp, cdd, tsx, nupC, and nupG
MATRLAEVAAYAKVSEATVSRVLNDRPGVAASTRAAVLTALDVLGYERPSQLRAARARLVGLVLPELQNPIFPAFGEVVADALSRRGVTPVLCTRTAAGVSEAAYVDMLLEQHTSGVIFFGGQYHEEGADHRHYQLLAGLRLPVVLINAAYGDLGFPRVSVDDAHATERAVLHLESLGHERIGFIMGPPDHVPSARKLAAYHALRNGSDALVEHTIFSLEGGVAAAKRVIRRGATAAVCASDILALGVVRQARKDGLDVPSDFSVVGFDDSMLMALTDPPLTTIRQPIEAMGQAAVKLLMSQIEGAEVSSEELFFEPELVVRSSTARLGAGSVARERATSSTR